MDSPTVLKIVGWVLMGGSLLLVATSVFFLGRNYLTRDPQVKQRAQRFAQSFALAGLVALLISNWFGDTFVSERSSWHVPKGAMLPQSHGLDMLDWYFIACALIVFVLSLVNIRASSAEVKKRAEYAMVAISIALVVVTLERAFTPI